MFYFILFSWTSKGVDYTVLPWYNVRECLPRFGYEFCIYVQWTLMYTVLSSDRVSVWLWCRVSVGLTSFFWSVCVELALFLIYLVEFTSEAIKSWVFFVEMFLTRNTISLIQRELFSYGVFHKWALVVHLPINLSISSELLDLLTWSYSIFLIVSQDNFWFQRFFSTDFFCLCISFIFLVIFIFWVLLTLDSASFFLFIFLKGMQHSWTWNSSFLMETLVLYISLEVHL